MNTAVEVIAVMRERHNVGIVTTDERGPLPWCTSCDVRYPCDAAVSLNALDELARSVLAVTQTAEQLLGPSQDIAEAVAEARQQGREQAIRDVVNALIPAPVDWAVMNREELAARLNVIARRQDADVRFRRPAWLCEGNTLDVHAEGSERT